MPLVVDFKLSCYILLKYEQRDTIREIRYRQKQGFTQGQNLTPGYKTPRKKDLFEKQGRYTLILSIEGAGRGYMDVFSKTDRQNIRKRAIRARKERKVERRRREKSKRSKP